MNNFKKYLQSVQLKKGIITESKSSLTDKQVKSRFSKNSDFESLRNCVFFNSLDELTFDEFKNNFILLPLEVGNTGEEMGSKQEFSCIVKTEVTKQNLSEIMGKTDFADQKIPDIFNDFVVYHCVKAKKFVPTEGSATYYKDGVKILSIAENKLTDSNAKTMTVSEPYYSENISDENIFVEIKKQIIKNIDHAVIDTLKDEKVFNIHHSK